VTRDALPARVPKDVQGILQKMGAPKHQRVKAYLGSADFPLILR
jgi:hypothetical protein